LAIRLIAHYLHPAQTDYSDLCLKIQPDTPSPGVAKAFSDPSFNRFLSGWRFFGLLLR
jgi:hypothetical protein